MWDRFDIVEAHYWWNADHHGGQWSEGYARLSRIRKYFSPGKGAHGPETENGQAIYAALCAREGCCPPTS